jgi:hypothetical protein
VGSGNETVGQCFGTASNNAMERTFAAKVFGAALKIAVAANAADLIG